jgi:hypothetical protein
MSVAIAQETALKLKFFMDGAWQESKSGVYMPVTNSSGPSSRRR